MKKATIGTVIHATLRPEDLLPAFTRELEWQIQRNGDFLSKPENFYQRDWLNNILEEANELEPEGTDEAVDEMINETLPLALEAFAGPYCYFGSHPGDGSDFGFWPDFDSIDELPTVKDSDEAKALGEDCKSVNDHGNVTVYGSDGSILLELV